MVDDDPRQPREQLGVAGADRADPLERAAVGDDHEVVGGRRVRVGPEPVDAGEEVVERRERVRADGDRRAAAQRLDEPDDRERRAERVGVGVLVADRQHAPGAAQPLDDGVGDGVEVWREVDASSRLAGAGPSSVGAAGPARRGHRRARRPTAAPRPRSPSCGRRATGVGSDSAGRERPAPGSSPRSSSSSSWRTRVPRSAVSSSWTCRSGIRLRRSRVPSSWRTNGIARRERGERRVALGRLADDADPDLGVAQVRRRLDARDRHEPDARIGHVPRDDRRRSPAAAARRPGRSLARRCSRRALRALGTERAHPGRRARRDARVGAASAATARLTVCEVKHSMTSPSSRSWKLARPMPHS